MVLRALLWLKLNNKYYRNITIDQAALDELPDDGNLTGLREVAEQVAPGDEDESPHAEGEDDESPDDATSFVPIVARKHTEQETVRNSVQERQQSDQRTTVPWPRRGDEPINEFTTEGYMTCAFPTLFPTGAGDFLAPRQNTVTVGNYFKHLMMYGDGQFAKHPRFRFVALNTEMRWRALQSGRIFISHNPNDARLTLDALRDMVGHEGEQFSSRVLHYASSLRGTSSYWFKQRKRLISMVDDLGLPTVFFTHSAADSQWPELARLICPDEEDRSSRRCKAVVDNPAVVFYHRISKFVDAFYTKMLGAKDYWYRFEWQHRGSPHVHGVAWLENAPDVEQLLTAQEESDVFAAAKQITSYVDGLISTMNPGISGDGGDGEIFPPAVTKPLHICNKSYAAVDDFQMDLVDLVATCQRHTRCSTAYCLRKKKGKLECRFHYPKPLQSVTSIVADEKGEPMVLTARNDSLLNSYNPVQLSAWRANVDMQYVVSRQKVINYVAKYATKSENRSKTLKEVFSNVMKTVKDDGTALKVVQKLMVSSVAERNLSAQETCHLLLQYPMFRATRDFVILSLDGSREVDDRLKEGAVVTVDSQLDHYRARPTTPQFDNITLLEFVRGYRIPKRVGDDLIRRQKEVVVIARPYCSPDPNGPMYEQYSKQKLMMHQPFRQLDDLLGECDTPSAAYAVFLQTGNVPPSLGDDIHRLEVAQRENQGNNEQVGFSQRAFLKTVCLQFILRLQENEEDNENDGDGTPQAVQDWMLICQLGAEFSESTGVDQSACDWSLAGNAYPDLLELPSFIAQQHQHYEVPHVQTSADTALLQGKQLQVYNVVRDHFTDQQAQKQPLRMVISGTAGTGKSYLIQCLKLLLGDKQDVSAPTGVASFNVDGITLHSLLVLPVKGDFKDLQGKQLKRIQ